MEDRLKYLKSKKLLAIRKIRESLILDQPEKKLWFAVLARAILDIGEKKNNSDICFHNPERLFGILFVIDLDIDYLYKTLNLLKIWPIPENQQSVGDDNV